MNENENNFESLRRLLALKRHETPPPGYFDNFSAEVTARIRAGDAGRMESASRQLPWLFRLLSAFEAKPAFSGAFASVLCMLLIFGIVFAERPDSTTQPLLTPLAQADPGGILVATTTSPSDFTAQPTLPPAIIPISSTNPVFNAQSGSMLSQSASMLFGQSSATVQPLTFPLSSN